MTAPVVKGLALPGYAELFAQSNFSFQHGASHPEELVVRARALGYQALALTDECSVAGVVRAHTQAQQSGLQMLPGAVFRLQAMRCQPSTAVQKPSLVGGPNVSGMADGWRMVVLPRHLGGWGQLCQYITAARGVARKGAYVATLPAPGSHALAGCEIILLPPRVSAMGTDVDLSFLIAVCAYMESVRTIFDDKNHGLWLGVVLHQAADDDWWLMQLDDCASRAGVPLVAAGGVLMHARSRKPLHDVLTAVRLGTPVVDCGQALLPNAQAHLRTRLQLGRLYPPDLLANTLEVARRCTFNLTELRYHYPLETVGAGETPSQTLARLTWVGAAWRYGVGAGCDEPGFREEISPVVPGWCAVVSGAELGSGEVASSAELGLGEVASHAAPPRGGPPSAYCEQKLSGGPPLARANHAGAASENQNQSQNSSQGQSYAAPLAGEPAPASGASAPTRSAAGRSGVGGDDFCSQYEEPPAPDRHASTHASSGEATTASTHASPDEATTATTQASPSEVSIPPITGSPAAARNPNPIPTIPEKVKAQIEHELALIAELGYEMYFLTVHDLVRFARSRDILCQGRGSAANSAVCYCLGVTEVDPSKSTLLFERFISRERNEPPDIDVDFEHQRREEVIQYIYAKYGRDRAALTATVISYRPRSALRDMGRALQVDEALIRSLAKEHPGMYSRHLLPERLAEAIARLPPDTPLPTERTRALWLELSQQLMGFPRHLSQHVGGFVLTQGPLTRLVPVEPAAMTGRSIIQWDKDDLDAMGLLKVDVLALGMLSALRRSLDMLASKPGALAGLNLGAPHAWSDTGRLTMAAIPKDDEATYRMTAEADTVGVFQIESRAQMSMLPRLRPQVFYDLVVQVAIVRPGPIQGGMVHPYLRRRHGFEPVEYPSPELKTALGRTLGVPIFQEQVMQVAMLCAGFSAGEADSLRRSMAAWKRKGGVQKFYDRVVGGMLARGYTAAFAEQIFSQIEGFGEYGFPESHAASFALLVYVSAWVKRHHPDVFLAALLNSQPMGFYSPSQLVQDARRHGVTVLPVDVMVSGWDCALEVECKGTVRGSGGVASHATPPRGGPPSAYCEQKLSGGPPLARADHAGAAVESQSQSQCQSQSATHAGESASGSDASTPTRSAAGRSGVGGDDFCSQYEEPPTPDRPAHQHVNPDEASSAVDAKHASRIRRRRTHIPPKRPTHPPPNPSASACAWSQA
jgi:DNA polymerase III alpha subunit